MFGINNIARFGVGVAGYLYGDVVIVAVVIGVVAFPEYSLVFLRCPIRIMQAMSRIKMLASVYRYFVVILFHAIKVKPEQAAFCLSFF